MATQAESSITGRRTSPVQQQSPEIRGSNSEPRTNKSRLHFQELQTKIIRPSNTHEMEICEIGCYQRR